MTRRPAVRSLAVYGLALGGVLGGHALVYSLLFPDGHLRAAELTASGHGYLIGVQRIGVAVALAALAVTFLGGLARPTSPTSARDLAGRILAMQLTAFAAMEVAERVGAGSSLGDLARILPAGMVVQGCVALAVAWVLACILRAADRVASLLGTESVPVPRATLAIALLAGHVRVRPSLAVVPASRAPPAPR